MLSLTGCVNKDTKFLWSNDEGAKTSKVETVRAAESRPALDVPPSLLGQVSLPHAESVAVVKKAPKRMLEGVAGKKVALDAKIYEQSTDEVFAAAVDAMTGLKLPLQGVDSASGTLTTDWVRKLVKSGLSSSVLGGNKATNIRYRFIVRVLKQTLTGDDGHDKDITRFEVHTVAQGYKNHQWSNVKLARRFSNELFSRVEENLAKLSSTQK